MKWESQARKLKASGHTYQQIGELVGVSRQRVQQVMQIKGAPKEGVCSKCQEWSKVLHCHHTNYETDAFTQLCPSCHARLHMGCPNRKRRPKKPKAGPIPTVEISATTDFHTYLRQMGSRGGRRKSAKKTAHLKRLADWRKNYRPIGISYRKFIAASQPVDG